MEKNGLNFYSLNKADSPTLKDYIPIRKLQSKRRHHYFCLFSAFIQVFFQTDNRICVLSYLYYFEGKKSWKPALLIIYLTSLYFSIKHYYANFSISSSSLSVWFCFSIFKTIRETDVMLSFFTCRFILGLLLQLLYEKISGVHQIMNRYTLSPFFLLSIFIGVPFHCFLKYNTLLKPLKLETFSFTVFLQAFYNMVSGY